MVARVSGGLIEPGLRIYWDRYEADWVAPRVGDRGIPKLYSPYIVGGAYRAMFHVEHSGGSAQRNRA